MNTLQAIIKICFSYIRFSSKGQADGSSVDRQSPIAARVAAQFGWTLREDLNASDLGVSAFKGDNIKTLETIIDAVKAGKIPQGSVMIIEAFDRFSRADLDTAEDLLKKVLKAGLEVYIDRGAHHLTRESLNRPIDRIIALLELSQANEYSAKLSDRVKQAVRIRREKVSKGEVIKDKTAPCWIDSKTWTLNGNAKIVSSIFGQYVDGMGVAEMVREFNSKNVPTLSGAGKWGYSVIYNLLSDRRTIGEYQNGTESIPNYYPAAVDSDTFSKVQAKRSLSKGSALKNITRNGEKSVLNLFSGVGFCRCGQPIKVTNGNAGQYVTCYGRLKGLGCVDPSVKYQPIERVFADILTMNPAQLLKEENTINVQAQILKGKLIETEKQIENITQFVISGKANAALVDKQTSLLAEVEQLKKQMTLEECKEVASKSAPAKLKEIVARLSNLETDSDYRATVQEWIREHVNRITFNKSENRFKIEFNNKNEIECGLVDGQYVILVDDEETAEDRFLYVGPAEMAA